MKNILLFILLSTVSLVLAQQGKPDWFDENLRSVKYPENIFITGFAWIEPTGGKTLQEATQQAKTEAQANLTRKILVQITSRTTTEITAVSANGQYRETESFAGSTTAESDVELTGLNTVSYYDPASRNVYAFAAVKREDLANYYSSNIALKLVQTEGLLQTAQNLEATGEKVKARQQCERADSLLAKLRAAQHLLTAIDPNAASGDIQQAKTETLRDRLAQMQARLAQAVLVYIKSGERNFSAPTTVVANQLKSSLSAKGCSFTDDPEQADFRIFIEATTRRHSNDFGFAVCFADVAFRLFDVRKDKTVFQDEFSQKGISTSQEAAGRKALEDAAPVIADKIKEWIQ